MLAEVLLLGWLDRLRGSGMCKYCHFLGMLGMGLITSLLLDAHGWTAAYVVAAVTVGASFGWGNPLGAAFDERPMGTNYEWWQVGPMRECTFLALIVRGALWGLPLAPVSWWAVLAFAIPFFVTPYLVRNDWALMEFTRGAFIGSLLLLGR